MKPIIRVENVSKRYHIRLAEPAGKDLREVMTGFARTQLKRLRTFNRPNTESIWALKNINFEVHPGDVLGFVGPNGAGKSTLLKILSRVTTPTTGCVDLYGRVGSLLEVGTGFHPELTGKENIFLSGAILGMNKREIEQRFEEIVSFSGVEKFLETAVKYYSSGMYMRLAFSVAAHLEPDILLVDEVLAVGDALFQKKCLGKMNEVTREGRTVLFVSHSMAAIESLCNRVIWLDNGSIVQDGDARKIVSAYLKGSSPTVLSEHVWPDINTAPGNENVRIRRACVHAADAANSEQITITIRTPFTFEFEYWNLQSNVNVTLSLHLYNDQGVLLFASMPLREPMWHEKSFPVGLFKSICRVPGDLINDGLHRARLLVLKNEQEVIFLFEDIVVFEVFDSIDRRGNWHSKWPGAVRPDLEWKTEYLTKETLPSLNNIAKNY